MTGMSKSIIEPQKVPPINLEIYNQKRGSFLPDRVVESTSGYKCIQFAILPYRQPLSGILDCSPSGKPILLAPSMQDEVSLTKLQVTSMHMTKLIKYIFLWATLIRIQPPDLQTISKGKDKKWLNESYHFKLDISNSHKFTYVIYGVKNMAVFL